MDFFYLDCFFPIHGEVLQKSLQINHMLVREFASVIDFKSSIEPHLTLYMGLFPDLAKVVAVVEQLNAEFAAFRASFDRFRLSPDGYIFWEPQTSAQLQALHEKAVEMLNPLRNGLVREKFNENFDSYNSFEQMNIKNFGFPWVMQQFNPHLTLGRIAADVDQKEVLDRLSCFSALLECSFENLQLGQVGENGTVKNLF